MKKLLLVLAVGLFTMSSCVQEDSISQVEEDDCGCNVNSEISGIVTGKVKDPYADTNGYHYMLYVRGCGEDETVSSKRHTVTEAIYNNFSVGSDICAN